MYLRHSLLIAALLVALCRLQVCSASYRIYIRQLELQSIFNNTSDSDAVEGHHVDIVRDGMVLVGTDGALLLTMDEGSGSGMGRIVRSLSEMCLPPLPASVNEITFSWFASTEVNYTIELGQYSTNFFAAPSLDIESTGTIPRNRADFNLFLPCLSSSSSGTGQLPVTITTTNITDNVSLIANFSLSKNCVAQDDNRTIIPSTIPPPSPPPSPTPQLTRSQPTVDIESTPLMQPTPTQTTTAVTQDPLQPTVSPTEEPPLTPSDDIGSGFTTDVSITTLPPVTASISESLFLAPLPSTPAEIQPSRTPELTTSEEPPSTSTRIVLAPSSTLLLSSSHAPGPTSSLSIEETIMFTTALPASTPVLVSSPVISIESTTAFMLIPSSSVRAAPTSSSVRAAPTSSSVRAAPTSSSVGVAPTSSSVGVAPTSSSVEVAPASSSVGVTSTGVVVSTSSAMVPVTPSETVSVIGSPEVTSSAVSSTLIPDMETSITLPSVQSEPIPSSTVSTPSTPQPPSLIPTPTSQPPSLTPTPTLQPPSVTSVVIGASSSPVLVPSLTPVSTLRAVPPSTGVEPTSISAQSTPTPGEEVPEEVSELQTFLLIVFAPMVGVLLLCILIVFCVILCVVCCRKKTLPKRFSDDPLDVVHTVSEGEEEGVKKTETPLSLWMPLSWGSVFNLPAPIQSIIRHFAVDRRSLTLLNTIMRGEYGCIVSGQLSTDRINIMSGNEGVLMKMMIGLREGGRRDEVVKFLEHATMFRGISHPNILPVLRVSVEDNYIPLVVYPLVEYGNLHSFLTHCRLEPTESPLNPVTLQHKMNLSLQIAYAMKFLAENGIIHHDLALRNCLLDANFSVKVADEALAHEFYPECYYTLYGAVRPVRWAAIETLQEGLCTSQSNVWSFAVTMWEILTLAEMPYSEVDNNRSILTHLMMDFRLPQPDWCPNNLYSLMQNCWRTRAEERPNFSVVFAQLQNIHNKYAAIHDSQYGPTSQGSGDLGFSTFGKKLAREQPASIDVETATSGHVLLTRHRSGGFPKSNRGSQASKASQRDSQGKLSITFSVLSGDLLGNGGSSDSETELEKVPEQHSPIAMDTAAPPSLLSKGGMDSAPALNTSSLSRPPPASGQTELSTFSLDHPASLLSHNQTLATSDTASHTSPPAQFGDSSSTLLDTSSYSGYQRVKDSSSTITPPDTSPSPDLVSKTSIAGDETLSMASIPTAPSLTNPANGDSVSKGSTLDLESISTTVSVPYPSSPSQGSGLHSLSGHYNGSEEQKRERSPLLVNHKTGVNGHLSLSPPTGASKSTDSGIRSGDEGEAITGALKGEVEQEIVPRDSKHDSVASRDSRTSRASFGLGLSDLMTTFETWKGSSS